MRAFVERAERRHAGRRQGRAARLQGPAAREPRAELRRRSSPRRSAAAKPGEWQALQTRDGWRAMRLDAIDAAEARGVRGPARRGAARLDRRHGRRAAHAPPCARWPRSTRSSTSSPTEAAANEPPRCALARCWRSSLAAVLLRAPARAHEMTHGRDGGARDRAGRVPVAVVGAERQAPDGRRPRRRAGPRAATAGPSVAALRRRRAQGHARRSTASASATRPRIVKVVWLDGQSRVYTLTSAQPTVQLYGSADDRRGMGEIARAYTVLGVEHILSGFDHLLFVRGPAVPGRLPAPADRHDHRVHARAQPDARVQRVRLDHAALAAGRGVDRAVDRAGRERGAARARHAGAPAARAGRRSCSAWCTASGSPARCKEIGLPQSHLPLRAAHASTWASRSASC